MIDCKNWKWNESKWDAGAICIVEISLNSGIFKRILKVHTITLEVYQTNIFPLGHFYKEYIYYKITTYILLKYDLIYAKSLLYIQTTQCKY